MHIKPFQAVYPSLGHIGAPDVFFDAIKEDYNEFNDSGYFERSFQEVLYVYRIRGATRDYTGLLACVDIRDYLEGHIRQHEHTLEAKEQKQMQLMLRRKAAVKPVLLAYQRAEPVSGWINRFTATQEPSFEIPFSAEQELHTFWEVKEIQDIQAIQALFEQYVPNTYIADGHHRTTTTAKMYTLTQQGLLKGDYSLLLCALFPSSDIEILDFNRVVQGLNAYTPSSFMAKLSDFFDIELLPEPKKPTRKRELTMLLGSEWYRLRWKAHFLQEYADNPVVLDTSLLNEKVLGEILGISDIRSDQRILYVEGPKGLDGLSQKVMGRPDCVAFCLFPVQLDEMITLADNGKMLPPKSTWFEPRMKNGVMVQVFD